MVVLRYGSRKSSVQLQVAILSMSPLARHDGGCSGSMFLAPAFSFSSRCSSHFLLRRASVLVSLVLAAALGLSVEPARAELIDIEFTGRITTSLIESTVFGTDENVSYEPGTPITGSISINAGATDSIPGGEIDQFNVDSSNATQENLPGAQWRLSVGATLPNLALPAEFVSGPFSTCLLYTSPSPRDQRGSRMPSSA